MEKYKIKSYTCDTCSHFINLDSNYFAKRIVDETTLQELCDFVARLDEYADDLEFTTKMKEYFDRQWLHLQKVIRNTS